jgi:hypothetical protein
MKTRLLLAFYFAIPVVTFAQSGITGIWKATDVGFAPWTLTLQANGSQLTGTVSQGGVDPASGYMTSLTAPVGISDGRINRDTISFKVLAPGGSRTITFTGIIDGNQIAFTRNVQVQPGGDPGMNGIYGASGATTFIAKRDVAETVTLVRPQTPARQLTPARAAQAGEPSGVWIATDVGFAPWTLMLVANGTKLTGTVSQGGSDPASGYVTALTAPVEISDGTINGDTISFKVLAPGGARTITFTGTIASSQIAFTRRVQVQQGGDPGMNGIYGASGATQFTARRVQ